MRTTFFAIIGNTFSKIVWRICSGYPIIGGRIDLHAWCVHKDGTIWDPDFPEYAIIKTRNGIPPDTPRMYEGLTGELKRSTWANVWM